MILFADIPLPYSIKTDSFFTLLFLLCFFIIFFGLSGRRYFLFEKARNFIYDRERNNLFDSATGSDSGLGVLLVIQTCILAAVTAFFLSLDRYPSLVDNIRPLPAFLIYFCACAGYVVLKTLCYKLVGWVFFGKGKMRIWLDTYFTILYYSGFILLPVVMLNVYFGMSAKATAIILITLLAIIKILSIYKWNRLFFDKKSNYVRFILYFCTLEIFPCLFMYKWIVLINHFII